MSPLFRTLLAHRSVVRIGGPDRHAFLQGLLSNDVSKVTSASAIYATLLTPQGKFLHDMFILEDNESFLIDCEAARADDLLRRLAAYKLRSKVTFENLIDTFDVMAFATNALKKSLTFSDPRIPSLGYRAFVTKNSENLPSQDFVVYDVHRLTLGVPDGSRDMEIEKASLSDGNIDFLNGIDWTKGCYVGQELTARMHYRGLAKKRLFPVRIEGIPPTPRSLLTYDDNDAGEMRSSCGLVGLALLKIETTHKAIRDNLPLACSGTKLWPSLPLWMKIDATPTNR